MDLPHLISIVGGGPGDPELLTVKAKKRLQAADVVLYDALLGDEIMALAPPDCEKIYVGKLYRDGQNQEERQNEIHRRFAFYAEQGKKVVRLKAGDPMIFGRGAEEVRFCVESGISYEVIPGITAALAGAARFNVAITEREKAGMALFYTAHRVDGKFSDIEALAEVLKTGSPAMIYMGLNNLSELAGTLLEKGIATSTPVQLLSRISQEKEKQYKTVLGEVNVFLAENKPESPAVIIIGQHVNSVG